jgi:DNA (cytosine-5)-methyltransferase 1
MGRNTPSQIEAAVQLLPTPQVADVTGGHRSRSGDRSDEPLLPAVAELGGELDWGPYAYAIDRWARVTGRQPPSPVEPGRNGKPRLSPGFVEWMQGLPEGWVTEVPGLSRNAQLKALGNGVVPQQAFLALRILRRRVSGSWKPTSTAR